MAQKTRTRGRPSGDGATNLTTMIVDVALEDFRTLGFEAASIEAIAARCRTSKHTIYRRFPTKEALFEAVVAKNRQQIVDSIASVETGQADVLAALKDITRALFEIAVSPGSTDLYRMCIGAIPRFPRIGDMFAEGETLIFDTMAPLVERGQAEGLLRQGDPRQIASQLHFATVGQMWLHALLGEAYLGDAKQRADLFEASWQLFLNGAKA